MGYQQVTPQMVAAYLNRTIDEFAAAYFTQILDVNQKRQAATAAVQQAGYAVGRGALIYQPRARTPDVQIKVDKNRNEYLQMKGRFSTDARARAGMSIMLFPSFYGPNFSASIMSYGHRTPPQQGIRANVKKEDIVFEPDGSVSMKLRFFPDRTLIPTASAWIQKTVLPAAGAPAPAPAPAYAPPPVVGVPPVAGPMVAAPPAPGRQECFGYYNAAEPACQGCLDAAACAASPVQA